MEASHYFPKIKYPEPRIIPVDKPAEHFRRRVDPY